MPDLSTVRIEADGAHVWEATIDLPGATFVKPHFVDFNLRPGDVLLVRSASGAVVEELRGLGPKDRGTFWGLSGFGDRLSLELRVRHDYAVPPFRIDLVIEGDARMLDTVGGDGPESVCSPADYDDAICHQGNPGKWANVLASVGVMTVGSQAPTGLWCSGSNVSPQSYLLTNQHCIENQGGCDNAEFVFRFYRTACNTGAPPNVDWVSYRCDEVVAQSPYVSCNQGLSDLDFTLASVVGDPASTFGYVQPDPVRLTDGEAIYIVQHPNGRPHEIAHGSGADVDVDGTVLRYYDTLDTEGGSSGSPIFRESDHRLVGLHHCGGCETPGVGNRGMLMADIYPLIEEFLCSAELALTAPGPTSLAETAGDGDASLEPGEIWQFTPRLRNTGCAGTGNATGGVATFSASLEDGMAYLLDASAAFPAAAPGQTVEALSPVRFVVGPSAGCGEELAIDLAALQADGTDVFPGQAGYLRATVGEEVVTTFLAEGFSSGLPGTWSVVDGGTGSGPAATWTTGNPGGRNLALTAPFAIVDSDELGSGQTMDEQLVTPVFAVPDVDEVVLQLAHHFEWYSNGSDERGDIDVRSSATGGEWVNVARFEDGSASGALSYDITAHAAGQDDVEVRFHYWQAVYEWYWAIDDVAVRAIEYSCDPWDGGNPIFVSPFNDLAGWIVAE